MSRLFGSLSLVRLTPASTKNGNRSVQLAITFDITKVTITIDTAILLETTIKFRSALISASQLELAILATTRLVLNFLSDSFPFRVLVAFLVALDTPADSILNLVELIPSRTTEVFVLLAFLRLPIRAQVTSIALLFPFLC